MPPEVPKFMRDTLDHNDIEGTRPVIKRELAERDPLKVSDIFGAVKKSMKP